MAADVTGKLHVGDAILSVDAQVALLFDDNDDNDDDDDDDDADDTILSVAKEDDDQLSS